MAGTLSLLDAALERWEGWEQGDPFDPGTLDQILAAARNWHTLTRHTEPAYEAVGRWYLSHYGIDFPASDAHAMLDAAVDALTVTAESEVES